jgi:hypothetical protein
MKPSKPNTTPAVSPTKPTEESKEQKHARLGAIAKKFADDLMPQMVDNLNRGALASQNSKPNTTPAESATPPTAGSKVIPLNSPDHAEFSKRLGKSRKRPANTVLNRF